MAATIHTFMLLEEGIDACFSMVTNPAGAGKIKIKIKTREAKITYPLSV